MPSGHLLFEMSFGRELTDLQPDKNELQTLQHQPLQEVIRTFQFVISVCWLCSSSLFPFTCQVFDFIFWNASDSFPSTQEVSGRYRARVLAPAHSQAHM